MKDQILTIALPLLILLASIEPLYSQNPTYNLRAMNFEYKSITYLYDAIEFDIYLEHTNPPVVFEYAGGQYMFSFNHNIFTGVWPPSSQFDTSSYSYQIVGSDLPQNFVPRNPRMRYWLNDSTDQLILATNMFPGAGSGYVLANNGYPGTKIVKMRLWNKTGSLNPVPLSLVWRSYLPNPFTKIFTYVDSVNTDITDSLSNSIDSSGLLKINLELTILHEGKFYPIFNQMSSTDSVTLYLREAQFPFAKIDSAKGAIDSLNFSGFFRFYNAPSGKYYIVVKHFQSIETWSRAGGDSLTANGSWHTYNFTTSASQAYGDNMKLKGSKYCIYTGDINQSGFVDGSDAIRVHSDSQIFLTGRFLITDLNGDNIVDGTDYLIVDNNAFNFIGTISP
jgi:hypothetical protein